jgi:osmotically-inducible protein OsmY
MLSGITLQSCKQNDQKIQENVQKELRDHNYNSVYVNVNNGVATLIGTANTDDERRVIESRVKDVKNVKSVINNIQIPATQINTAPAVHSDQTIKTNIESRLNSDGFKNVKVEVNNGEVTLTGNLKRSDLTKVMQIANESNPRKVNNQLTLQ